MRGTQLRAELGIQPLGQRATGIGTSALPTRAHAAHQLPMGAELEICQQPCPAERGSISQPQQDELQWGGGFLPSSFIVQTGPDLVDIGYRVKILLFLPFPLSFPQSHQGAGGVPLFAFFPLTLSMQMRAFQ